MTVSTVDAPASEVAARRLPLLAAASAAVALAAADTYVVVLALTDMMAGVGIGIDALQRATPIISGFLLGYIAVLPLIGRLSDLLDRRRILLGCLVVFVVGSAITALAVEMPVLVTGRVLQGIGGGGLVPATLALVADLWPADRRGTPLGAVGAVQELGSVLGPVLGAVILAWSGWRAIFWANVAAGVVLYAVIRVIGAPTVASESAESAGSGESASVVGRSRVVTVVAWVLAALGLGLGGLALAAPDSLVTDVALGAPFVAFTGDSRVVTPIGVTALALLLLLAVLTAPRWWVVLRRADLVGALLVAVALGSLVLTFASSDPEKEVVGPLGYTLLPFGALAVLALLWWHRRAADPLVPRGVVHARGLRSLGVSLLVGVALVAVIVDVPLLARLSDHYDETGAALVLVRFLVAVPAGAFLGGWSLRRLGDGLVAGAGLLLGAAGMLVMSGWTLGSVTDTGPTTTVLVLVGFGVGLALAPVNNAVLADSPSHAHGVASSLVVVARMVGMVVGLALLTSVGLSRYFDAVRRLPDPLDTDALVATGVVQVQTVFLGGALAALVGGLLALTLGLRRAR
ncbi:MFS transporter [Intrasporangium oryzae NRRL B-24470]|uniref:MFS transporter n=1 Tax=Intrasporangium oryzae NRRL B-24470 TaxID=1386089 RepID=W9GBL2_9MICO|nr:MFS transporter [Intrasporangium oryzae]EWT01254.1 MFS transporter [Intrasporangium oryzae NRRL B-24470]